MKVLAVLLALIVPPLVYFSTIGRARQKEQQAADAELRQLDRHVRDVRSTQTNMQDFMQEDAALANQINDYRITLPPRLGTTDILRTLEAATTRNGVQLIRFAPRAPTQAPPLQMVSVEAETEGPQPAIDLLLRQLGDKPQPGQRFLTVSGVTSTGSRTSFVVTGYALPDSK